MGRWEGTWTYTEAAPFPPAPRQPIRSQLSGLKHSKNPTIDNGVGLANVCCAVFAAAASWLCARKNIRSNISAGIETMLASWNDGGGTFGKGINSALRSMSNFDSYDWTGGAAVEWGGL